MSERYVKSAVIEVVERTPCGGYLVQNEGKPDDRWIIDSATFESTYKPVGDALVDLAGADAVTFEQMAEQEAWFGIGLAVDAAKEGYKVTRGGWNGQDQYVVYQKGYPEGIAINKNTAEATGVAEGTVCKFLPYLMLRTVKGSFIPWAPSVTDALAEDWHIVK